MNEDQYNKFFRDKLLKHPSQVPDDMWERIMGKKKRRYFFFWLFMALLPASFMAGYFLMQKSTNSHNATYTSLVKQKTVRGNNKDTALISDKQKEPLPQQGKEKNKPAKKETNETSANATDAISGDATQDIYPKATQPINHKQERPLYANNKPSSLKKNTLEEKKELSAGTGKADSMENTKNITDASVANNGSYEKPKGNDKATSMNTVTSDPLAKDPSQESISKKDTASHAKRDTSSKKSKAVARNRNTFFTVYFSPAIPISKYTPDNIYNPLYYSQMKLSYTMGASIGKTFGKKFSAQTGLLYSQVNMIQPTNDSARPKTKVIYRNLDAPLIFGYNMIPGNFTTTIHAGAIFNLSASTKGSAFYDSTGNPVNIYRKNTGISLYFGLAFTQRLNRNMNLFAEPYFMYRPSYIATPQFPLFKQQINMTGISLGLKYNF